MSSKLKVGIVGAGAIAQLFHIPGYLSCDDVEIIGISDINEDLARMAAEKFGIPEYFADYNSLLALKPDCISVCTPNKFHAPISMDALKLDIGVLCEKPLAMDMEECAKITDCVRKSKGIFMLEFPMRFDTAYAEAKRLIEQNLIGDLVMVKSTWAHGGPEKWSPKGTWFFDPALAGGGAMADLAVHCLDAIRFVTGADISEVCGLFETSKKPIKVEDNAVAAFKLSNGALGVVDASWCVNPQIVRTEVYGTQGRLYIEDWPSKKMEVQLDGPISGTLEPIITKNYDDMDPHLECIRYFVKCAKAGKAPDSATLEDGIAALDVVMQVYNNGKEK